MRSVLNVFVVLALCTAAFCGDQPQENSDQQPTRPFTLLALNGDQQPRIFTLPEGTVRRQQFASHADRNDGLCYTMHSIYVQREHDSDVTRQVGESTCTPARKFKVKPKQ